MKEDDAVGTPPMRITVRLASGPVVDTTVASIDWRPNHDDRLMRLAMEASAAHTEQVRRCQLADDIEAAKKFIIMCSNECKKAAVVECVTCAALCAECDAFIHRGPRHAHIRTPLAGPMCSNECKKAAVLKCVVCAALCAECDAFIHRGPRHAHTRTPLAGVGSEGLGVSSILTADVVAANIKFFD